jgi:RNA polymerase sigma-70 factor, ECF subfamily
VNRPDAELIAACRKGDAAAFEILYRRHRDWVVNLAYRFCGHREDALDVLQDTWAYVLKKLPSYEPRAKFTTFLYPVVKHLALDRAKRTRRHAPLPEGEEPATLAGFPDDTQALLDGLSATQQEILGLRFVDGLDLAEIADVLRIPLGTVKSRLHHALAALRKKMERNEP